MIEKGKIEVFLVRMTNIFLFAALASPLISSSRFMYPFLGPAVYFFQLCVFLAAVSFFLLVIIQPSYFPRRNIFLTGMTVFFLVQFFLLPFSVSPWRSFMGSVERYAGVWNLLHYFLFFLIATSLWRSTKDVRRAVIFSLLVSFLTTIEYFALTLNIRISYARYAFGNPGFFANYVLLHIPFAIWLLYTAKNREEKILLIFFLLIQSFTIINSGNRAAFLALLVGTVLFGFYFLFQKKQLRIHIIIIMTICAVGFSSLMLARNNRFVQENPFLNKITDWSLQSKTFQNRLLMWRLGWKGIHERPLVGWGRDNFNVVFDRYYDPDFFNFDTLEQWMDRGHNIVIDELVFGGLINALSLIFLFGIFAKLLWGWWRCQDDDKKAFAAIFLIFFVMYFTQLFFTLDTLGSYLPLFLGFTIIAITLRPFESSRMAHRTLRISSLCIVVIFAFGTFQFSLAPLMASYHTTRAIFATSGNFPRFLQAQEQMDRWLHDRYPFKAEVLTLEGSSFSLLVASDKNNPKLRPFQDYLIEKLGRLVALQPTFLRLKVDYAYNLSMKALMTDAPEDHQKAIVVWEELYQEYPTRQPFLLGLGTTYIVSGDSKKGLELLRRAVKLSPKEDTLLWNVGYILHSLGRSEEAIDYFSAAIKAGFQSNNILQDLRLTLELKKYPKAFPILRNIFLQAIAKYPADPDLHANLAFIYGELGEFDLAFQEAEKARSLRPDKAKEIDAFLRALEKKKK